MDKTHILVIDDDPQILDMLRCTFEEEGYSVDVAADGRSGLNLQIEHKPDLVLWDIRMPDLNGYQVLELIREQSNVPVVVLTGVRELTSLNKAVIIGADDYVQKTFSTPILLARIKNKLKRARSRATSFPHHRLSSAGSFPNSFTIPTATLVGVLSSGP